MRARAILFAVAVAAMLALAACTGAGPSATPPAQKDAPERGGDHGGGGMM